MAATIDLPKIDFDFEQKLKDWTQELRGWRVVLYNDHFNKKMDVVLWLQKATGCALETAEHVTDTAHTMGRAVCYTGGKEKCQQVASFLRGKTLQVEITSD